MKEPKQNIVSAKEDKWNIRHSLIFLTIFLTWYFGNQWLNRVIPEDHPSEHWLQGLLMLVSIVFINLAVLLLELRQK